MSVNPILVTGGAGFTGSHACDRLLESGRSVICLKLLAPPAETLSETPYNIT